MMDQLDIHNSKKRIDYVKTALHRKFSVENANIACEFLDRLRIENSLENGFEYDHSMWVDESADFLRKRISSKLQMIIVYADLVGSTKIHLDLPGEKAAIIIGSFSQEMGHVIKQHNGYVLKYVGDAVIGFFLAEYYPILVADNAVNCAKSMITIIKEGINPILNSYE